MSVRCNLAWLVIALALAPGAAGAQGIAVDKSEIKFTVKQLGVNFDGRFGKWKADVVFQPKALAQSKADIDVDLGSIDLASPESEAEAKGPLWFNTSKFPVAHFSSTAFRDLGETATRSPAGCRSRASRTTASCRSQCPGTRRGTALPKVPSR